MVAATLSFSLARSLMIISCCSSTVFSRLLSLSSMSTFLVTAFLRTSLLYHVQLEGKKGQNRLCRERRHKIKKWCVVCGHTKIVSKVCTHKIMVCCVCSHYLLTNPFCAYRCSLSPLNPSLIQKSSRPSPLALIAQWTWMVWATQACQLLLS